MSEGHLIELILVIVVAAGWQDDGTRPQANVPLCLTIRCSHNYTSIHVPPQKHKCTLPPTHARACLMVAILVLDGKLNYFGQLENFFPWSKMV